jgi:ABC-type multidrug transport system fused ATPase/permease subunit
MRNLWRFLAYSKPYSKLMSVALVASLLRMAMSTYMPFYVGKVVDYVGAAFGSEGFGDTTMAPETMWHHVWVLTAIFAACLVMHIIVTVGRVHLPQRASAAVVRDIRFNLFAHIQRLSLGFHTSRPSGAIASRVITDVQSAQQAIELGLIVTLQAALQIGVIGIVLLCINWQWALVCFSVIPLFLISTHLLSRPLRNASRRMLESTEEMSGHVHERFGMIREVQSFGAEEAEQDRVWEHTEELRTHSVRHSLYNGMLVAAGEGTTFLGLAIVLIFGVYSIATNDPSAAPGDQVTVGMLTTFFLYTQRMLIPVQWLTGSYGQVQTAVSATGRIFEFFDTEPKIQDSSDARDMAIVAAPTVTFDDVRFSYPSETSEIVLNGMSFAIPGGSRVVLVGPSGGGKSTTLSLLPRFYDVQGGRILINGADVREVTVASLRAGIGIVPQEPVLFSGTIRENILYGRPGSDENAMLHAATSANAHDFIMAQPAGYDTVVGERGVGLSGGQIQRIAIARAFLKNPPILILDEPTSNLDATSEMLILEAIDRLAEGRTTFVIAHRLSVARSADVILYIEDGKLIEQGHHEELLAKRGAYHDLWQRQVGG